MRAARACTGRPFLKNWTWPSAKTALAPPVWKL
jgi:hypothetical protein